MAGFSIESTPTLICSFRYGVCQRHPWKFTSEIRTVVAIAPVALRLTVLSLNGLIWNSEIPVRRSFSVT